MKRIHLFFLISCLSINIAVAQEKTCKVLSMVLDTQDLSNDKVDLNGEPLAKIIINIPQLEGAKIKAESGVMESGGDHGSYYAYVTAGKRDDTKRIEIQHSDIHPLEIVFSDYGIDKVVGKRVYIITVEVHVNPQIRFPIDYNPKFKMHLGIGLNPMLQLAPAVNIGFDCHRWNVWLSASHSLTTSKEAYVYNSANELLGKHNYHYLRFGLNVGYEFEPWKRKMPLFGIMPQVGIALDHVYSSEKEISGNGFNAYKFLAGVRIALKTNNRHWCFFATPELNLNLGSNPNKNYENITGSISNLKKNFDVQVGVLYYF